MVVRSARVGRRKVTKGAGSIYAALGRLSYAKCDLAVMQLFWGYLHSCKEPLPLYVNISMI